MKWKSTSNKFIAFFDIMGFKNLVYRNSHNDVLKKMHQLRDFKTILEEETSIIEKSGSNNSEINLKTLVKPVLFSDSFVMITNGCSVDSFTDIIGLSISFMGHCFENNIPVKGAISRGKLTADFENSIFFGQPLIDAFLLQEELQIYGCILDDKSESFLKSHKMDFESLIYEYKTPLKKGKINHQILDCTGWFNNHDEISKAIASFYLSVSGEPRIYVDNTIDFLTFLNNKQLLTSLQPSNAGHPGTETG